MFLFQNFRYEFIQNFIKYKNDNKEVVLFYKLKLIKYLNYQYILNSFNYLK